MYITLMQDIILIYIYYPWQILTVFQEGVLYFGIRVFTFFCQLSEIYHMI